MNTFSWITDPHLDHVTQNTMAKLCSAINEQNTDALIITGDIADGPMTIPVMTFMDKMVNKPIYFLLGNHDFYDRGIEMQRTALGFWALQSRRSIYMPANGIVELNPQTAMVGFEGWADGRYGDFRGSQIKIVDYAKVLDLLALYRGTYDEIIALKIRELGELDTAFAKPYVERAVAKYNHVLFFTHVPPFEEAAWHDGEISDHHYLPHFGCKAMGDMLKKVMRNNPTKQMTVYCGHMHDGGEAQILDNLKAITGTAQYGNPKLLPTIEIPNGRRDEHAEQRNSGADDQASREPSTGSGS